MRKIDKKVTVGMPQELYDTLKKLAEEDRRSIPSCIRLILWEHVEKNNFSLAYIDPLWYDYLDR